MTERRNLEQTLQALYDSEINVTITMLWDGGVGFSMALGAAMVVRGKGSVPNGAQQPCSWLVAHPKQIGNHRHGW